MCLCVFFSGFERTFSAWCCRVVITLFVESVIILCHSLVISASLQKIKFFNPMFEVSLKFVIYFFKVYTNYVLVSKNVTSSASEFFISLDFCSVHVCPSLISMFPQSLLPWYPPCVYSLHFPLISLIFLNVELPIKCGGFFCLWRSRTFAQNHQNTT